MIYLTLLREKSQVVAISLSYSRHQTTVYDRFKTTLPGRFTRSFWKTKNNFYCLFKNNFFLQIDIKVLNGGFGTYFGPFGAESFLPAPCCFLIYPQRGRLISGITHESGEVTPGYNVLERGFSSASEGPKRGVDQKLSKILELLGTKSSQNDRTTSTKI